MTALLFKSAPLSIPRYTCPKLHRLIHCSSSSSGAVGASSPAPDWWHTLVSHQDSSQAQRMQARKRLRIAGIDQDELVDPWLLADADSRFAELCGVHIHYKIADPTCAVEEEGKKDDGLRLASESSLSPSPSLSSTSSLASSSALSPASSLSSSSSSKSSQTFSSTWQSHPVSSSSSTMLPNAASSNPVTSSADPSSSPSDPKPLLSSSPKVSLPIQGSPSSHIPAVLLHGFGASLFSWERILRPLAKVLGSKVIAFDRPAFGLTTRIEVPVSHSAATNGELPLNPYSVSFSSNATIAFVDFLQSKKAVLIGHSAGCIVAADAYFKAPERIVAIVMVAPALVAPISLHKKLEKRREQNMFPQVFSNIWAKIGWAFSIIGAMAQALVSCIKLLWYRVLAAFLRSDFGRWLIRLIMDKVSLKAVRLAWYDKEKVDDYVIAGYTKPLKCRDWERALLEYVLALAGNPSSDDKQVPLSKRVEEIKCPVLVITGDSDFIVPAWNAERLAKVLPNAQCHVIKNCGHLPHEEKPQEFLTVIQQFMQRVQQGTTTERTPDSSMVFTPA